MGFSVLEKVKLDRDSSTHYFTAVGSHQSKGKTAVPGPRSLTAARAVNLDWVGTLGPGKTTLRAKARQAAESPTPFLSSLLHFDGPLHPRMDDAEVNEGRARGNVDRRAERLACK